MEAISVSILDTPKMVATIPETPSITASMPAVSIGTGSAPPYKGEYTVVPKAQSETTLETAGKVLQKDVTVMKIPKYETTNPSGGITLYIASDEELEVI